MNIKTLALTIMIGTAGLCTLSSAQCFDELRAGSSAAELSNETVTVENTLLLFERAVRIVEPALPSLVYRPDLSVLEGLDITSDAYQSGVYLVQRGLLPNDFNADTFDASTWQKMKNLLLDWYDLPHVALHEFSDQEALIQELSTITTHIRDITDPVLIVASENRQADILSFLSLMHLQGPYPRLIVLRPLSNIDISRRVQTLLPLVSTCVFDVENYVYAPQDTATRLFFSSTDAETYIVISEPNNIAPFAIPIGEEVSYFQFTPPEMQDVDQFSVVFAGSSVGAMTVVRMLPQLRTNLGPRDIIGFFNQ